MLEDLFVLTVVALAGLYLLRRTWALFTASAPGGCACPARAGCPAASRLVAELARFVDVPAR